MTSHVVAFAALAAVLVVVPGPAVLLVLKSAVLRGRCSAVVTAFGVLVADLIWATASILGLTALLVSSQLAFDLVRVAGAAYLVYLGAGLLLRPSVGGAVPGSGPSAERIGPGPTVGRRRAFVEGLVNDLSNPKTVIVYASVIPQFLGPSGTPLDLFVLGLVFAVLGFVSLLAYALVFGAARGLLARGRLMRTLMRVSGAVLVGFGAGLLIERPSH